jgi:hypothetical protein
MKHRVIYNQDDTILVLVNEEDIVEIARIEFGIVSCKWSRGLSDFASIEEAIKEVDTDVPLDYLSYGQFESEEEKETDRIINLTLKQIYRNEG